MVYLMAAIFVLLSFAILGLVFEDKFIAFENIIIQFFESLF